MTAQTRFLRFADLQERKIVNNRTTLSRWINNCGFPPGVLIGPNSRAWTEDEIEAWFTKRRRMVSEAETEDATEDADEDATVPGIGHNGGPR